MTILVTVLVSFIKITQFSCFLDSNHGKIPIKVVENEFILGIKKNVANNQIILVKVPKLALPTLTTSSPAVLSIMTWRV